MLIVRVDDNGAAKRAVAALREIERQIPKSIRDIRRDAFKDAAKTAKGNLGGGHLRGPIARGTKAQSAGDESSLISNKVDGYNLPAAVNASNRYMVDSYRKSYSSGWRHPVHGNRNKWVTQQSPNPGWFTSVAEELPIDLGVKWTDLLEEAAEYVAART